MRIIVVPESLHLRRGTVRPHLQPQQCRLSGLLTTSTSCQNREMQQVERELAGSAILWHVTSLPAELHCRWSSATSYLQGNSNGALWSRYAASEKVLSPAVTLLTTRHSTVSAAVPQCDHLLIAEPGDTARPPPAACHPVLTSLQGVAPHAPAACLQVPCSPLSMMMWVTISQKFCLAPLTTMWREVLFTAAPDHQPAACTTAACLQPVLRSPSGMPVPCMARGSH